ncbi:hypothetical protein [Dactylosporangium sp. CA-139066]|uniref:hypothetical protein n=1 Tax=Dactylosporangium sp. CA-139066 TaxID=3239930 RepID=UPI003D903997
MQDPSDSTEIAEPAENSHTTADASTTSTMLAEVLPGVAVVFGDVPAELRANLIDFGLVSTAHREQISAVLASVGAAATTAGNLGTTFASIQGLYRISDETRALLMSGASLAVKDGANLGAVMVPGRIVAQARFIPVKAFSAARAAAALGPALAQIAMQMQLTEVTDLARTNVALTSQVLTAARHAQWAELTALVATIDRVLDQAREIEAVPTSLWDTVAGKRADLQTQLEVYRLNVSGHIRQIQRLDTRARREYLEMNAEAIVFDANALLASVKAWIGYQALHAARARTSGHDDADEARLVEVIARDTQREFDAALAETTSLVGSLTRELRIIAELPGRDTFTLSLPGMGGDAKAARQASARLLKAIEPLADALRPPAPPLEAPGIVCAPASLDLQPYLRVLRWFLEDGETLRVLGFPDQVDTLDPISAIFGGALEKLAAALDKATPGTLVAVTDRRIVTAKTDAFLEQGELRLDIPVDQVRYVRAATAKDKAARPAIDLITRDENIRWLFPADIDNAHVGALAAVLAESMTIPEAERDELLRWRRASIEAGERNESAAADSMVPAASPAGDTGP